MKVMYQAASLILAAAVPSMAFAQELAFPSTQSVNSYPASYFDGYGPVTAFDMIARLPGFSFRDGGGARGFGVNAGNVLINGSRPTIKSETLESLLKRIPARSVVRIEIIDQALGSDLAGLGRVANVVLKSETMVSGTYGAALSAGESGDVAVEGQASVTVKGLSNSLTLGITRIPDVSRTIGPEFVTNIAGVVTERRDFNGVSRSTPTSLSVAAAQTLGDVKVNASAKVSLPRSRSNRVGQFFNSAGTTQGTETLLSRSPASGTEFELAGDVQMQWSKDFSSKLLGLYNSTNPLSSGRVERIFPTGLPSLRLTENRDRSKETVIRLQNGITATDALKFDFGAELALNRLDAAFTDQFGGGTTNSLARVRETRFEPFVSADWSATPDWKFEVGLIVERSILDVTSTGTKKSRFLFWKPRIVANWAVSKNMNLEFKFVREAAQLDFNDFATSVDLGVDGQVDFGNRELIPERTSTYAVTLQQRFWDKGSVELILDYVDVKDLQDLVPVSIFDNAGNIIGRFDGPGNIGQGKRWNVELSGTVPLDRLTKPLGISGMEFKFLAHHHGSQVSDPVTRKSRLQSGVPEYHFSASLRQDLVRQKIAWGLSASWGKDNISYFINQISRNSNKPNLDLFIEYRGLKRGTLRLDVNNLTDRPFLRDRQFFVDTRATGLVSQRFFRDQRRDSRIKLSFSTTF
jgi:outer membrane receptor protein involved in Fe transport